MTPILLADDDTELTDLLTEYLSQEGFEVSTAHEGNSALAMALSGQFELVVLDVMMPGMNGFDVLRQLRSESQVPVLMLTARGDDVDSVVGLELGADDYLPKPCNPRVLVAHMRAILRRSENAHDTPASDNSHDLQIDDVVLQRGTRRVLLNNTPLSMTSTEFTVLSVLLEHAGEVVSKQALSQQALGRELSAYDRSLDMHVSNLRKKLGTTAKGEERITTVRGVGYQYMKGLA
jgi:DNA-binding response OmpR family regulator